MWVDEVTPLNKTVLYVTVLTVFILLSPANTFLNLY